MRLSRLIESINGRVLYTNGEWEREINSLCVDSRKAENSSLFFCLTGGKKDGHAYAGEAVKRGAVALVVERELAISLPQILVGDCREALGVLASVFYGNPTEKLTVVGITGTNGKTTTSYMLENIFKKSGRKTGVIGTLGVKYDEEVENGGLTTPDPIELQAALAKMLRAGVEVVVMEVSAHALYYKKTVGVRFSACIFTNLTQDHLDFFPSMQAYREAKERLFSTAVCPLAVVNGDDEIGRELGRARQKLGGKTVYYGLLTPADAFAVLTDEGLKRTECMLNINDKLCRVSLSLVGRHNVYNALAAATCAVEFGVETGKVAQGLSGLKGVRGRLEWTASYRGGEIYVDFAHTPDGLEKSLQALRRYCKGRLICLFGCGGNRDRAKRPLMGEVVAKRSDFSILTSDNPRYEDPLDILAEVEKGYRRFSSRYVIVPDRERAIAYALEFLRAGDVLLIAGKGGEEYQEIMGIKYPFDDHAKVIDYIQGKGKKEL